MKFKKTLLVATLAIAFAGAAFAQSTQTIPIPASSVDTGGRAVRGFTIPLVPTTQQVTDIALQAIAANPSAPRAWTSYFLGQGRYVDGYYAYIDGNGAVIIYDNLWGVRGSAIPNVNGPVKVDVAGVCGVSGLAYTASPTGFSAFGGTPTGWTAVSSLNYLSAPCSGGISAN